MGWKMVRYLYHCSICSHFNSSFGHLLYTPDRIYVAAVKGFIIICFAGTFHSQLCGIWHLHFYGNTFRGRNYFPISSPANREFYCPCIRCLVRGPLSSFFRTAAAVWFKSRHRQSFGRYIAVTTSHITHQYPARPRPPTHSAPSRRFAHKQKQ